MKKEKRVYVFTENMDGEFPEKPKEFFAFWNKQLSLIPEEYIPTAKIEFDSPSLYEGDTDINVTISYARLETDEEEERRERATKSSDNLRKQRELNQLFRLKVKYPGY